MDDNPHLPTHTDFLEGYTRGVMVAGVQYAGYWCDVCGALVRPAMCETHQRRMHGAAYINLDKELEARKIARRMGIDDG